MNKIIELLNQFKIVPKNLAIYEQAFTHSSLSNLKQPIANYERLEFLGDSIISKIVAEHLYKKHPELDENGMSKARNIIVQSKTEIIAAKELNLIKYIKIGESIKHGNGISDKILEDVYEALIGAIYLDQGEEKAYRVIKRTIIHYYEIHSLNALSDFKTMLQEKTQTLFRIRPRYKRIYNKLPNKVCVEVWCNNKPIGFGSAENLKDAEFAAAKNAYQSLIKK
jgi:ribonuclease-3